jgi:hypothetical protein
LPDSGQALKLVDQAREGLREIRHDSARRALSRATIQ